MSWLDALLGRIRSGGVDIPLSKGINFANGLQAVLNQTTKVVDVSTVPSAPDAAAFAPLLRGVGLTQLSTNKLSPRPRFRRWDMYERFASGGEATGTIGQYGWKMTGVGTPVATRQNFSLQSSQGKIEFATSASINDRTSVYLAGVEGGAYCAISEIECMQFIPRHTALTTRRAFYGTISDFATDPASATNCLGFMFDTAINGNWHIVSRVSSVGSPVNTGIAVTTALTCLSVMQTAVGAYEFRVGNDVVGSVSGVADSAQNFGMSIKTLAASSAAHRSGGVIFRSNTLGGVYSIDQFLEA